MQAISSGTHGMDALVLLHGMGTGASAWQPQIDALSAKYHTVAPYLPAYGANPGPFSMSVAGGQVESLLVEGNLGPAHVCGLSLGALVALEVARDNPAMVRSLILSAGFVSLPEEYMAPRRSAADSVRGLDADTFRESVLPDLVRDVPNGHRETALEEIAGLTPADLAELISFEFDARTWIGNIRVPALVLCGDKDEANLPLSRELAERLPNARFEVVPGAGHVANLDAPVEFTTLVESFLESV